MATAEGGLWSRMAKAGPPSVRGAISITALDESGLRWQTDRLSIDGIRLDEVEGCRLAGVADPDDSEPRDFVVDLDTGRHEGGTPLA